MRGGLDDALEKLARRDELRRRAASEATGTPPAVTELIEAIVGVVGRHPALAVTVGVEGAGDPTLLHFGVEDGIVQVNADHRVAARAAEESPARHADFDFDIELDEPAEERSGGPAPEFRHVSYDDRNRYDPGTGYDSVLYDGPTAPVHTPPRQHAGRDAGTPDRSWTPPPDEGRTRRIFPQQPDEAYPRAGARPGAPQPTAHRAEQHPRQGEQPQRPAAPQHRQPAEPRHTPAAAAQPAADRSAGAPDRPAAGPPRPGGADRPHAGAPPSRGAPEFAGGSPTAGGPPPRRGEETPPQRGMPAPLPEPIPLQVDPEEAELAAKRLAALLREDPTLLRRAHRA